MNDVIVFSIATGAYFDFWTKMVESANKHFDPTLRVSFLIVGDSKSKYLDWRSSNCNIDSQFIEVSALPWPLTTLFRFKYLIQAIDSMNSDFVMLIDADMEFVSEFSGKNLHGVNDSGIALVRHPGYFRTSVLSSLSQFGILKVIARLTKDLVMRLKYGGIGTWENNPISQAFVKRRNRKIYVCGGIWWGRVRMAKELARDLETRIDIDLSRNVIATYHDESHLNNWLSRNSPTIVGSEFCFDSRFPMPSTKPVIQAVDKNLSGKWHRI